MDEDEEVTTSTAIGYHSVLRKTVRTCLQISVSAFAFAFALYIFQAIVSSRSSCDLIPHPRKRIALAETVTRKKDEEGI